VFFPGFIKGLGKAVGVVKHLSLLARHGGLTHRNDRFGELGACLTAKSGLWADPPIPLPHHWTSLR
jgi:hypothetical protein